MGSGHPSLTGRRGARHPAGGRPADAPGAEDEAAVEAARKGDLRAWEHLVRKHQELVFRTAYLATRDSTDAEESAKAAFIRSHRSLGSRSDGTPLRPWLMSITATVARTHQREMAQRRDARPIMREPSPRLRATPVAPLAGVPAPTSLERAVLLDAFDGMVDDDRLTIASRYAFALTREEVAARLAIPSEEVDARLAVAMGRLRARIATPTKGTRTRSVEPRSGRQVDRFLALVDDALGGLVMAGFMTELPWTPDVAPAVSSRLAREAVAYPERPAASAVSSMPAATFAAVTTMSDGRRSALRGGSLSLKLTALVVAAVVVGIAASQTAPGRQAARDLGTRLSSLLDGAGAAPEGSVPLAIQTIIEPADDIAAADPAVVGPVLADGPALSIVGARTLDNGDVGARVRVDWPGAYSTPPITRTALERRVGTGSWTEVASASPDAPLLASVIPGRRYQFRIRTFEVTGESVLSPILQVELAVHDPRSDVISLAPGDWITRRGNVIKRRLIAISPDASLSVSFDGNGVALIGPAGPTRGAIGVRVDDGPWTSDDLRTWQPSSRTLVFSQDLEHGVHSLDLRAEADGVAVDAVLVTRARLG